MLGSQNSGACALFYSTLVMTCSSQMRWQEAATLLPHLTPAERALFFVGGGGQSSESLAMLPLNATKQKPEINPFKIL